MSLIPSTKPKPKDQSEEEKIEEGIVDLTIDTNCLNDDNYLTDDDNEPICMSCNREIDYKSDIFYISGFKYHLSCIKCASCGKVKSKPEVHFPEEFDLYNDLNSQIARNLIFGDELFIGDNYEIMKKRSKN